VAQGPASQTAGPAAGLAALPEVGTEFLGFRLIEVLGQGAFGRVYLARQGDLANRPVALKVSARMFREPQTLAQLQHTNIVPIYSVHQAGPFQAVCMPYFGSTSLDAVFSDLQSRPSLPASGEHFVSTIADRKSTVRSGETSRPASGTAGSQSPASPAQPAPAGPARRAGRFPAALETLKKLSYPEAVLWIGARLADGLGHAHERGILHRDLKPANVLLTDDGQPMLLDFNLSEDTKLDPPVPGGRVGGTLLYMAPEQLEAFRGDGSRPVDGRSDLFSLGVLLYELLTGRPPFGQPTGPARELLARMIADRREPPPALRRWNRAVSPAVEAVVRRCIEPEPERRYQSARELVEDLECQLNHLPLRHTREPSARERAGKWLRRHPRLASATTVAVVAAAVLVAGGAFTAGLWQRQRVTDAEATLRDFRDGKVAADFLLNHPREPDRPHLEQGLDQARSTLERLHVLDDPRWQERPAVRLLPARERERVGEEVADLLWSLARATSVRAVNLPDAGTRHDQLVCALDLNRRAEACLPGDRTPKSLWSQRAELADLLGRPDEARRLFERADKLPPESARDHYRLALKLRDQGRTREAASRLTDAIGQLREATRKDPRNYWAWYLQGNCHDLLLENPESITCYTTCGVLNPDSVESFFNRGLAFTRQGRWEEAGKDFDRVIALRPGLPDGYVQRALAARDGGDYAAAERHFSRALELGSTETRIYFWRAAVRDKRGDIAGARRDRAEGFSRRPRDEHSWVERGLARLPGDAEGALADFEQALRLNRRYFPALQDRSHVLCEHLAPQAQVLQAVSPNPAGAAVLAAVAGLRYAHGVETVNRTVALYPDAVPARIGRAVLLARLGKREQAHREAGEALARDHAPVTVYQAANVYALTSRQEPEDRRVAFPLLSRALEGGFGLNVIDQDGDMDPIRSDLEFRRIVNAARELRARAQPSR
jgi:serine/threonine protein kinase/tetratricopeptide (TPR) repeat protein